MRKTITVLAMAIALALSTMATGLADEHPGCQTTVDGLTANYVNMVPTEPFDVTCDIGIYFDEDATIDGVELSGTVDDAMSRQYGIYVDGADVDVTNSSVTVEDDYPHEFVPVIYMDATGTIADSDITGPHRSGIVLRGEATDVTVIANLVSGTGEENTGWAQNGVQVDQGATATITKNTISDHGYLSSAYASTGLLLLSDGVTAHKNELVGNTYGVGIAGGNGNNLIHNEVSHSLVGAIVFSGDDNGFRQNSIADGVYGIYLFPGVTNTKLIRNSFTNMNMDVIDGGTDTNRPKPFVTE